MLCYGCCFYHIGKMYYADKMYIGIRQCLCSGRIRSTLTDAGTSKCWLFSGELQRLIIVLGKPDVSREAPVLSVHFSVSVKYMKTGVLVPMQVWDSLARSSTHTVSQKDSILIRQANDSGVSDPCYVQLFFPDEFRRANFHRASSIY